MANDNTGYFKKRSKDTFFWDPTQPKNKKILGDQVVKLEKTDAVEEKILYKAIVEVDKKEYDAYVKSARDAKSAAKSASDTKSLAADERLKLADQKLKDAEKIADEAAKKQKEIADKEADLAAREAALSEANDDDKSGKDK